MALFRWFGLLLIVLAVMLIGADVVSSLEMPGASVLRSFDKILMLFGIDLKPWVQNRLPSSMVNPGLSVLAMPGWAVIGFLAIFFALLGQIGNGRRAKQEPQPDFISHH